MSPRISSTSDCMAPSNCTPAAMIHRPSTPGLPASRPGRAEASPPTAITHRPPFLPDERSATSTSISTTMPRCARPSTRRDSSSASTACWAAELLSRRDLFRMRRELRCPLDLLPVERPPFQRALDRPEQHDREQLPVREALQPDVEQQPPVSTIRRMPPLQAERQHRRDEVDDQKRQEVRQQLLKTRRVGRARVEVTVQHELHNSNREDNVDKRRHQRQQDLENQNVRQ